MTTYNLLKEGFKEEGSEKLWQVIKILSNSVDTCTSEQQKEALINCLYYQIYGGHYNREFADKAIAKFYYEDTDKTKHQAPYWIETEVKEIYNTVKSMIPSYNQYDFEVTLNMMKSDNYLKLKKWFPEATQEELKEKLIDEAINYLSDDDNPYGNEKIWRYLNS